MQLNEFHLVFPIKKMWEDVINDKHNVTYQYGIQNSPFLQNIYTYNTRCTGRVHTCQYQFVRLFLIKLNK